MRFPELVLRLPGWIENLIEDPRKIYPTPEDRMSLVIQLSLLNIKHGTGGPFGAAIFDCVQKRLISVGVNLVIPFCCSVAHAEIVAIALAQQVTQQYNLGSRDMPAYELVTSTEPCAMCFGAIPWSGVRRLVNGARQEDAMSIGFDEGPRPSNWIYELERRGVIVERDVLRESAAAVLRRYHEFGGAIYNGGSGDIV